MKDDYNTNSHYLTYALLFREVGRMYFLNLGAHPVAGSADTEPWDAGRRADAGLEERLLGLGELGTQTDWL